MSQTLNSSQIDSISLFLPEYGIWTARIVLTKDEEFPPDSLAEIVLFDLTLQGTIKFGGKYFSTSSYFVVGGGGNWGRKIPTLGERALSGTKLSSAAKSIQDAANLAGKNVGSEGVESISVPVDKFLGQYWQRQAGPASSALSALTNNRWYVDLDGTTVLNSRNTKNIQQKYLVQSYDPIFGSVTITVPESDSLIDFVPGCIVSTGLPEPLTLKELTITSNISGLIIEGAT